MRMKVNKKQQDTALRDSPKKDKKRGKRKGWILLIVMGCLMVGIWFLRKPILDTAMKIPIIAENLPKSSKEVTLSYEQLNDKVNKQIQEISGLKKQIEELESEKRTLMAQNEHLKEYESQYTEFIEQKNSWDQSVAEAHPELFIEQFEKMNPEHAEHMYSLLKGEKVLTDQQKQVALMVGGMDAEKAAAALEKLLVSDSDLIQVIFNGLSKDNKAKILSEMTADTAAKIIKLVAPNQNTQQEGAGK